jgi:thiol-disulfide isomerase/thioredoxin
MLKSKMLKKSTFKLSNILFVIAIALLLYSPTRVWLLRQIAFSPSIEKTDEYKKINTYNWQLKGLNTTDIDFQSYTNEVVLVNFWATWCPPCKAEMPMLQSLYNDYKNKIKFVFVTNENWNVVQKYFEKENYNLPVYNSISNPPQNFTETNSIPATYLINKNGEIVIKKIGAANWNSKSVRNTIDKLIGE